MNKIIFCVCFLFVSAFNHADVVDFEVPKKSEVYLATIPKSGTNLMQKIMLMLDVELKYALHPKSKKPLPHLINYISMKNINKLEETFSSKNKYIVTVRDPRDFIVSYLNWVSRGKDIFVPEKWRTLSKEKQLNEMFKSKVAPEFDSFLARKRHFENYSIAKELSDKKLDNVLIVRFEDFVGAKGGGTDESQRECVKKICSFLDIKISEEKLNEVCSSIWGGTNTFTNRTKKVGQWVDVYKPHHVSSFKKKYNSLLVDFGYEKDLNWG